MIAARANASRHWPRCAPSASRKPPRPSVPPWPRANRLQTPPRLATQAKPRPPPKKRSTHEYRNHEKERAVCPWLHQRPENHVPGAAGTDAGYRFQSLLVRLAGDPAVHRHGRGRRGRRGGLSFSGGQTGDGDFGRLLGAVDRLAAGDESAALGTLVDRCTGGDFRHRADEACFRGTRPEPVQPGHGWAYGHADLFSRGDDRLGRAASAIFGGCAGSGRSLRDYLRWQHTRHDERGFGAGGYQDRVVARYSGEDRKSTR